MTSPTPLIIRTATDQDVPLILTFIRALAEYEKLTHEVVTNEAELREHLFGPRPCAEVVIAEAGSEAVGFALFFHTFSTFVGKPGLYLEDVFVNPEQRGKGYGKALMVHLARLAQERGCGRFEWSVLNWNTPSIAFYKRLGALMMEDWTVCRLNGASIERLAADTGYPFIQAGGSQVMS